MSDFDLDDLVKALGCWDRAYRRDECGDWMIEGKQGHIYAHPEGFYLYCSPGSVRAWGFAKKALAFCVVTQDGDDEGFFRLARLPTVAEAEIIRDKLGIRKKKELSEDHLKALRAAGSTHAFQPRRRPF
jgi:hypothetical protein